MVRYLVYGCGNLIFDSPGVRQKAHSALNLEEATALARDAAMNGTPCAVFKEFARYDPAEPDRSEPR